MAGIMAAVQQYSMSLATLQERAHDAYNSVELQSGDLAMLKAQASQLQASVERIMRILTDTNGEKGLVFRTAMLERSQVSMTEDMREHRVAVEGKLTAIQQAAEQRAQEAREQKDQMLRLVIGFVVQIVIAAAGLIVALMKH